MQRSRTDLAAHGFCASRARAINCGTRSGGVAGICAMMRPEAASTEATNPAAGHPAAPESGSIVDVCVCEAIAGLILTDFRFRLAVLVRQRCGGIGIFERDEIQAVGGDCRPGARGA